MLSCIGNSCISIVREMRSIWTGLNDVVDEGTFVWDGITALVVNYTNWERDGT